VSAFALRDAKTFTEDLVSGSAKEYSEINDFRNMKMKNGE
jgi:hypothetical protein